MTWEFFKKYLFSKRSGSLVRLISWICILATGIGVFSLVLVISVMNGFNDSLRNRLLSIEPHLVIPLDKDHEPAFWQQLLTELNHRPETKASLYESADVIVRTVDGYVGGAVLRGVSEENLGQLMNAIDTARARSTTVAKPPPDHPKRTLKPGEVLMGLDLAVSLGVFEDAEIVAIAPEALLLPAGEIPQFERLKVRATLSTNVVDLDGKMIYYLRGQTGLKLRQSASFESGIEVRLDHPDQAADLQNDLAKRNVRSETWAERNSSLFFALKLEKISIGALLSLSALIASFSIVAVLSLLMTQKRRDLGLLMALGLSPRKTRWTFVRIGLVLSGVGIGCGLFLGLAISLWISYFPIQILPDVYHDRSIPATVNWFFVVMVAVCASAIAVFSSWWPAKRNTSMTPAEALRGQTALE